MLHSNIGVFENNQPVLQMGIDVLPGTIHDAIENNTTPQQKYQHISYVDNNHNVQPHDFVQNSISTYSKSYRGWGGQSMFVLESEHMLLGFGIHRTFWYHLHRRFWLTSHLGMQMSQLKIESNQISINFLSPYADVGFSYLISPETAISIKGNTQSNLFLISNQNNINYGIILGISKGIHPLLKY